MKQLTNDEIIKNCVETINQYRVLQYLKKESKYIFIQNIFV